MKSFFQILDEICQERFNHKYVYVRMIISGVAKDGLIEDAAKEYAKQVATDALLRASDRGSIDMTDQGKPFVYKPSILNTDIILP